MDAEQKIDGTEAASTMTIQQKVTADFVSALCVLPRKNHKEIAQEAQRLFEAWLAGCNEENFSPDED